PSAKTEERPHPDTVPELGTVNRRLEIRAVTAVAKRGAGARAALVIDGDRLRRRTRRDQNGEAKSGSEVDGAHVASCGEAASEGTLARRRERSPDGGLNSPDRAGRARRHEVSSGRTTASASI